MPLAPQIEQAIKRAGFVRRQPIAPLALKVDGAPCAHCQHFRPVAETESDGTFGGVRLCHTPFSMARDFSCFQARE